MMPRNSYSSLEEQPDSIAGSESEWILPLAITGALSFTAEGAMFMLIQLYLNELEAPPIIISLNATLVWLGVLLGSLLFGVFSDRFPRKPLLFLLLGASALAMSVLALLLPPSGVLPLVFVRALFITGLVPISMTIVSSMSLSYRRGRNLSYISFPRAIGMTLGTALAGFLIKTLGFKYSFLVFAFLPLLAIPVISRLSEKGRAIPRARESFAKSLKKTELSSLYLASILTRIGALGSLSLGYVYMASLAISEPAMGIVSALGVGISIPGMLVFGRLADRLNRKVIFLFGFGTSMFAPLIFASSRGIWGMAAGYLSLGISFSAYYMGSAAHIGDLVPRERQGQMLGLLTASMGLGGVLGPLVAGATVSPFGFHGMFWTLAGIAALGFLLVLFGNHGATSRTLETKGP